MEGVDYEGHITITTPKIADLYHALEPLAKELGYHFSCISGWDDLGPGRRCYFTRHSFNGVSLETRMLNDAAEITKRGYRVERVKVEKTIQDHHF